MEPNTKPQMSLASMLGLVACIAVNLWLFRVSIFWGIVAVNVTKHVAIAALCQIVGLNRSPDPEPIPRAIPHTESSNR